jgi:hypothetical protein
VQAIAEWHDVDRDKFRREIQAQYRPAVLRGIVKSWPAVERALESSASISRYLAAFDNGASVDAIRTPPSAKGRIFYTEDMNGFNFTRERVPISSVLERMSKYAKLAKPPAVAVQSALVADCLPGFAKENRLPILDASVAPRIWLGNAVVTPAHFDESHNIACVVSGRRRFTLFPPEQITNLYIGPIGYAPTGSRSAWSHSAIPTSIAFRASGTRSPPRRPPSSSRETRSTFPRSGGITSSRSTSTTCW